MSIPIDALISPQDRIAALDHQVERLLDQRDRLERENVLLKRQVATLNEIIRRMDKQLHPDG